MTLTAAAFTARIEALRPPPGRDRVRMGDVFGLAKEFGDLPLAELDILLDSGNHLVRVGALRIMGNQAGAKRTSESTRADLFALYLRRTDRIDTWDLVDLSAHQVVGAHLRDKPRDVLYDLARSPHWWERRIAMFATLALVRAGDADDTFALAEMLVDDPHEYVNTVVGGMLREAGKHDRARLLAFLDEHAATAPRVVVRFATEHLEAEERARYLAARRASGDS
ncbi:DNA alkylation repair protein [Asanoa sp. WMMD1127]|uniref:DNA alkylation repair protein n=1 Tax=Asanoa sp. WMMD1127 TaxID=3016107 RepID=UPI0024168327|nr:DNA alkylation repair protein [Asanoa sp. WMMD1127]MDG4826995.1 DNA alkylation repair protein [Asanoa sp. WMMD1127]